MILNEYSKTAWINGASPDINKANLDNLEQGVHDVTAKAMELAAYETNAAASATAANASAVSAAASAAVYTDLAEDVTDLAQDVTDLAQDVTDLAQDVTDLTTEVSTLNLINGLKKSTIPSTTTTKTMSETWELGSVQAGGAMNPLTNRIRTNRAVRVKAGTKITLVNVNYMFSASIFNLEGVYQSQFPYQTADYIFASDCLAYFVVKKPNDSDLTSLIAEASSAIAVTLYSSNVTGVVPRNKYMHISIDDTIAVFLDLTTNSAIYTSIFDNAYLNGLKTLHDTYGAIFSMYCYGTNGSGFYLEECTDKFASEFRQNSAWLKFGFHALNGNDYTNADTKTAQTHYEQVVGELYRICGGFEAIDRFPRVHLWSGNANTIKAWRNCKNGIVGLLTADSNITSYSMSTDDTAYLQKNSKLYDNVTKLTFMSTDIRTENYGPLFELRKRYHDINFASRMDSLIIFTHEWQDATLTLSRFEECCQFARDYGYIFEFPQNLI